MERLVLLVVAQDVVAQGGGMRYLVNSHVTIRCAGFIITDEWLAKMGN
jgi:hypothetical protein